MERVEGVFTVCRPAIEYCSELAGVGFGLDEEATSGREGCWFSTVLLNKVGGHVPQ